MTGDDMKAARANLGEQWGLGRDLNKGEMGRALGLGGKRPDEVIGDYESGKTPIGGPAAMLVRLYLAGARPPHVRFTLDDPAGARVRLVWEQDQ
jgi:hypothetical protein